MECYLFIILFFMVRDHISRLEDEPSRYVITVRVCVCVCTYYVQYVSDWHGNEATDGTCYTN